MRVYRPHRVLLYLAPLAFIPFLLSPQQPSAVSLEEGFRNPPASARPRVWWHWMNGNITEEGIRLDLEWMSRVGIGGVQNFDAALDTPKVVDKRLAYMTPEWKHAFQTAVTTADRLGLEFTIASSPGWSETGGPWVKPEDAMKKLVWTETDVSGGKRFQGKLAQPSSVTGPFQDLPMPVETLQTEAKQGLARLYRDTVVLAYRLPSARFAWTPVVTSATGPVDSSILFDGKLDRSIGVPNDGTKPGWLLFDFGAQRSVSAVAISIPPASRRTSIPFLPALEVSTDGKTFRRLGVVPSTLSPQSTLAFAPVNARMMRIVFERNKIADQPAGQSAPGAIIATNGGTAPTPLANVYEVRFFSEPRVHRFEAKAAFAMTDNYYDLSSPQVAGTALKDIVNLTDKMVPDGSLDWTPPPGAWRILRMGYSLTGKENHPATDEATGFEVDKYDSDAVRRYIDTYLDTYVVAAGAGNIGAKGIRAVLNDSIEVGNSNWSPRLIEEFKARRGYDPTPWLPVLAGAVVDNSAKSDAFLYDFRRTLADLLADAHYRTITAELHKRGLTHYSEALERGCPSIGDDMDMRRGADIPMAAMWTYAKDQIGPQADAWADIRGAASVAHVYGQNLVAAESLTARDAPWAFAPKDLQPMIDMEFALGVNRPVIHTSVHQPLTDHAPGFSLSIFGHYFNRLDTWTEMAKPWVTYISRNAYMLQQGRFVADVAYLYGEEAPLTALFQGHPPTDVPLANGFDYINGDVVLNQLSNDGDSVVAKSGARYRVIYLGGSSHFMTLAVLKRLNALVQNGATIVGVKPSGSPALMDDSAQFAKIAEAMWNGKTGQGTVVATRDLNAALARLQVAPDFSYSKPSADTTLMFVHRQRPDADIYYFTNRRGRPEAVEMRFRVAGKSPEFWDAETGAISPATYRNENGQTVVAMNLRAHQSGYIVFRETASSPSLTVVPKTANSVSTLDGPWTVTFQAGRGAPTNPRVMSAADWVKDPDPRIRYFSGTASYQRNLTVIGTWLAGGQRLRLDLGEVDDVAEVLANGRSAGIAWNSPYRVDLTDFVKPGENNLEVRVANLWVNRLIGDVQPGAQKIAFTIAPTYRADAPLRPSGLVGPIRLETVK